MTAGATEPVVANEGGLGDEDDDVARGWAAPPACVITADGTYGARLTSDGESWYPERWTLDGPEPYAVPLPSHQPEEPGTEVLPLTDGRVLIHRIADGRHTFSLLYPTGPGTGELPLGAVECPDAGTRLRLLPPAPDGERAYALAVGRGSTAVWLVAGGAFGPEHLAEVPGHCSGGVWLDGTGRLLALDRFHGGRTKTVVVDLERGGEVSPLLQIAEHSNDRLLLADADSGLLLIRSDAPSPGRERLGWGVLGSTLPVRFPECLSATGCTITPFAIQPGQVLTPEACAVALRLDGPGGTWVGMWRPSERRIDHRPAPDGWLAGTGLWTREGVLQLPYATGGMPCGVARLTVSAAAREPDPAEPAPAERSASRPVPLQQASLKGRLDTSRHTVANAGPGPVVSTGPEPVVNAGPGPVMSTGPEPVVNAGPEQVVGAGPEPVASAGPEAVASAGPVVHTPSVQAAQPTPNANAAPQQPPSTAAGTGPAPDTGAPADTAAQKPRPAGTPGAGTPGAGTPGSGMPSAGSPEQPAPPVGTPEPAKAREPRPALWTKVAATPPPGRSLGAGFIATLPVEVEVRPTGTETRTGTGTGGDTGTPSAQAEFNGSALLSAASRHPGPQPLPEPAQHTDHSEFSEFRGEAPLRSFEPGGLSPEPWGGDAPPDHETAPTRRTPPAHRRPLHAGPPEPAAPAPEAESAPPAAAHPDAAAPGDGEEVGGEDEETSPSGTRAVTAR